MILFLKILAAIVVAVVLAYVIVKFIPLKLRGVISVLLLIVAGYLVYLIDGSIQEPIRFNKEKEKRYAKVIDNLKLIRDAQVKYKEVYGEYSKNKDVLISFIKTGKLAITSTSSEEKEVHVGGGITKKISVRKVDTVGYEPVLKHFEGKKFENMFKVPGTENKEFTIETGKIEKVAGLMVPVFEAKVDKESILKGMNPMLVKQELEVIETDQIKGAFVSVGSLEEISTGGNWPPSYDKLEGIAEKK